MKTIVIDNTVINIDNICYIRRENNTSFCIIFYTKGFDAKERFHIDYDKEEKRDEDFLKIIDFANNDKRCLCLSTREEIKTLLNRDNI